jgi:hypothetical protein
MKSLPVSVIADPISGHVFALPFAPPTLRTAMSWQRSLDDLPTHRWLRGLVLRVARTPYWRLAKAGRPTGQGRGPHPGASNMIGIVKVALPQ